MRPLSVAVALFGLAALVQPVMQMNIAAALLGGVVLVCAVTTFLASKISSFLKVFVSIFSTETIVFGIPVVPPAPGIGRSISRNTCSRNRCR